jgi:hypothetical protein
MHLASQEENVSYNIERQLIGKARVQRRELMQNL